MNKYTITILYRTNCNLAEEYQKLIEMLEPGEKRYHKCKITFEGSQKLAYPVQGYTEAIFTEVEFYMNSDDEAENIPKSLTEDYQVIRFLMLRGNQKHPKGIK